jgi:hypothetical protein
MALDRIVRNVIAIADRVTGSLQVDVQHLAWTGIDGFGAPTYAPVVIRPAHVEHKQSPIRTRSGDEVTGWHILSFLRPIVPNGAAGREEPIDLRDKLVMPGGDTGPILDVSGYVDRGTLAPYYSTVVLG